MELDERKARVLRAVVDDFIRTAEPVGSRMLAERHEFGVSSATIRNDLAALEDHGFLSHPHTSAGRVPTDRGYRYYVDSIDGVGQLARAQHDTVGRFLEGAADLEELLARTSMLLSSLTRYTAMVSTPSLDRSRLRHVELVALGPRVVLLVLITDTGRVEKRHVEVGRAVSSEELEDLRARLNEELDGERLDQAERLLAALAERLPPERRALLAALARAIGQVVGDRRVERVFVGGQAHLAGPDAFQALETVRAVYQVLEQQVVLMHLLQAAMGPDQTMAVTIGSEHTVEGMEACSVVSARYPAGGTVGTVGVLGPTRMDYLGAMGAVHAVAGYLGALLDEFDR